LGAVQTPRIPTEGLKLGMMLAAVLAGVLGSNAPNPD